MRSRRRSISSRAASSAASRSSSDAFLPSISSSASPSSPCSSRVACCSATSASSADSRSSASARRKRSVSASRWSRSDTRSSRTRASSPCVRCRVERASSSASCARSAPPARGAGRHSARTRRRPPPAHRPAGGRAADRKRLLARARARPPCGGPGNSTTMSEPNLSFSTSKATGGSCQAKTASHRRPSSSGPQALRGHREPVGPLGAADHELRRLPRALGDAEEPATQLQPIGRAPGEPSQLEGRALSCHRSPFRASRRSALIRRACAWVEDLDDEHQRSHAHGQIDREVAVAHVPEVVRQLLGRLAQSLA